MVYNKAPLEIPVGVLLRGYSFPVDNWAGRVPRKFRGAPP